MSLRPFLEHRCYNPRRGQTRPFTCRCRKRHSREDRDLLVASGLADWDWVKPLKLLPCPACRGRGAASSCEKCGGTGRDKKNPLLPCKKCASEIFTQNPCFHLDCFGTGLVHARTGSIVRVVVAVKTPRVMTIERANIERWLFNNDEEEGARIEAWDDITQATRREILTTYWPMPTDPFVGMPVIRMVGGDLRTSIGRIVDAGWMREVLTEGRENGRRNEAMGERRRSMERH